MAFLGLVRDVKLDALGQVRELRFHHFLGALDNVFAAGAGGHAAEQKHVFVVIKLSIMRQRVAEIYPDGVVNFQRPLVSLLHERLHDLQLFRQFQRLVVLDAGGRQKAAHGLLRKVLRAAAEIARPLVRRRLGMQIDRRKSQFTEPRGDVSLHVDVAAALARAHGDAKHAVLPHGHRAGQRGDFAVVDHVKRHPPFLGDFEKHAPDFFVEKLRADAAK